MHQGLLRIWMFYSKGQATLQLTTQTWIHLEKLQVNLWSIRWSYWRIWSPPFANVNWHSAGRPITVTFYDLQNRLDLHRITICFNEVFATDMACQPGTRTLPDTCFEFHPFLTRICSNCRNQFSPTVKDFQNCWFQISLGSSSILH